MIERRDLSVCSKGILGLNLRKVLGKKVENISLESQCSPNVVDSKSKTPLHCIALLMGSLHYTSCSLDTGRLCYVSFLVYAWATTYIINNIIPYRGHFE